MKAATGEEVDGEPRRRIGAAAIVHMALRTIRRTAGPVLFLWSGCLLVELLLAFALFEPTGQLRGQSFGLPLPAFVVMVLSLFLLGRLRLAIWRPVREVVLECQGQPSFGDVLGDSLAQLPSVVISKLLLDITLTGLFVVGLSLGAPVPLLVVLPAVFLLNPVLYLVPARKLGVLSGFDKTLALAREHGLLLMGIQAMLLCLAIAVQDLQAHLLAAFQAAPPFEEVPRLAIWLGLNFGLGYLSWIVLSATFLCIDEADSE